MPSESPTRSAATVTVWTSAARAGFAGELLDVMGGDIQPVGIAGPRSTEVDALGKRLDCPAGDDLRKLLIDRPAAFLLLTTWQGVTLGELRNAAATGTRVLTLEPWATQLEEIHHPTAAAMLSHVSFVPAFTACPGYRRAADPHDHLDAPRFIRFTSYGRPEQGTLIARLIDAWTTVLAFTSMPESIDASLTGPSDPPRQVSGRLAAHARNADGGAIILEVADHAPARGRTLSVLSNLAHLVVTDSAYRLVDLDGQVRDSADGDTRTPTFADLIAQQWRTLLDRPVPPGSPGSPGSPTRHAQALACAHACLLSARTGQPESPGMLLTLRR